MSYIIYLAILPLAFDFKGQNSGGGVFQLLISFICFLSCLYISMIKLRIKNLYATSILGGLIFFSTGVFIVSMIRGVDFGNYVRVFFPFLLYLVGFSAASKCIVAGYGEILRRAVYWGSVISIFVTFFVGLSAAHGDVFSARYKIVSSCVHIAIISSIIDARIKKNFDVLSVVTLISSAMVIILSSTRSLALASILVGLFAVLFLANSAKNFYGNALKLILGVILMMPFVYFLDIIFPEISNSWGSRFDSFGSNGFDLTSLTRIAEINGMLEILGESIWNIIFGVGLGREYYWTGIELDMVVSVLGSDFIGGDKFEAGHNFWIYSLYSGGLFFGLVFPVVILSSLYYSIRIKVKNLYQGQNYSFDCYFSLGGLSVVSFVLMTIGGNPLGPRYSGLLYGILLAFIFVRPNKYINNSVK